MKTPNPCSSPLRVPRHWRDQYQMLKSLRRDLLNDRARLTAEKKMPKRKCLASRSVGATDGFSHNLALGILSIERDAIYEVDSAIQRIMDGSYGICEVTGKPIPVARLRVVPWTRYTKEALERAESQYFFPAHAHPGMFSLKTSGSRRSSDGPSVTYPRRELALQAHGRL